jgi:hypothetical protein
MTYNTIKFTFLILAILISNIKAYATTGTCTPSIFAQTTNNGSTVSLSSSHPMTSVTLKFCDGSHNFQYNNLHTQIGSYTQNKEISGVIIVTNCNNITFTSHFSRSCNGTAPTCTPTARPSNTPIVHPTATRTPAPTATSTPIPHPTATRTATPRPSPTPTCTVTPTVAPSPTRTATPRPSPTPTCTITPTVVPSPTRTMTPKPTVTIVPTTTRTPVPSPTSTIIPVVTPTIKVTVTPIPEVPVCYYPDASSGKSPVTIMIPVNKLEEFINKGYVKGNCPKDCMGVSGGKAVIDECGVCGGNGATCLDCAKTPNGTAKIDVCGVCNGNGTTCLGCDGIPNSQKTLDACGVCGGDNSTCLDCRGIPNGGAVIDSCGVCGGDNSTCLDCAGVVNGTSRLDKCGICGGNDKCDITTLVDKCGVVGGKNECLDCAGIPNGGTKIDCCGVCGGDGSTCLDKCTLYDTRKDKARIIKSLRSLLSGVSKYTKQAIQCKGSKVELTKLTVQARKINGLTQGLITGYIKDNVKLCNTAWCKKSDFNTIISRINRNLKLLLQINKKAQYASINSCGRTGNQKVDSLAQGFFGVANKAIKGLPKAECVN